MSDSSAPASDAPDYLSIIRRSMPPFARLLGMNFTSASPERLTAELVVRGEICTTPPVLHGGALMALADTAGACATMINLRDGESTTTLESKTNFLAPAPLGSRVTAECVALHRGRRTMVWQTRITSTEGRLLAQVTQTQMVLARS